MSKTDDAKTWGMTHAERATVADVLATLTPEQWAAQSWCGQWTVRQTAAHIVTGAEQTVARFTKGMVANGFRFNTMMDRNAKRLGTRPPDELIDRLRARVSTTNGPPAPPLTMLGEIVVHGHDICRALGVAYDTDPVALLACLDMYKVASFPLGTKKRIEGLRLRATDIDWAHGQGPEVSGPAIPLMMAMTGRRGGLDGLSGDGLETLRRRMTSRAGAAA
ncbi:MAG TPA: maleylpyruvate isomerase family mycothiol-dependent enzyme [Ilumatobacteraceae bacterium]|jgi:uncharacterized protein (TIGR03083 family)